MDSKKTEQKTLFEIEEKKELEKKELFNEMYNEVGEDINSQIVKNTSLNIYRMDRHWTVETIHSQVVNGNIELNPKFQRRNVWDDERKQQLIESLMLNLPIPNIVIVEDPNKPNSFIIVDGKQRLQAIIGFRDPEKYPFWNLAKLKRSHYKVLDIEGKSYQSFSAEEKRILDNSEVLASVIKIPKESYSPDEYKTILYDIFYRLNASGVRLSFQELRQVMYSGEFTDYLIDITNYEQPIHRVTPTTPKDNHFSDVEILVRLFSNYFFKDLYKGSIKDFLDLGMELLNKEWKEDKEKIISYYKKITDVVSLLENIFDENVGKFTTQRRFNLALFESQVFAFSFLNEQERSFLIENKDIVKEKFNEIESNRKFQDSFRLATNTSGNYSRRLDGTKAIVDNLLKK